MSIYAQFKTSKTSEENGITVRFAKNEDGTIPSFRIGRQHRNNKLWVKTFEAKTRPFRDEIDNKTLSDEEARSMNIEIFVTSLLFGWENIQMPDIEGVIFERDAKKNLIFNKSNAIALFSILPELYEALNEKTSNMENFLEANIKECEKN